MDFTNPNPVGSGPFNSDHAVQRQDTSSARTPTTNSRGSRRSRASSGSPRRRTMPRSFRSSTARPTGRITSCRTSSPPTSAKDPAHYHNAYLTTGLPVALYFDLTKYPYSLVGFRKGVSLAINRQDVSSSVSTATPRQRPLSGSSRCTRSGSTRPSRRGQRRWPPTRLPQPRSRFQAAGFTYKGSTASTRRAIRSSFDMHVIGGWSDWVASLQIVSRNLQAVGIDANVKLEPDWGAWQPNAMSTKFVSLLWNNGNNDVTPYPYFYAHYDPSQNLGPGVDSSATGNWEHYSNGKGGPPEAVQGDPRSRQAEGDRVPVAVDLPRRASRSCRCSSARAGRRTARSTSTG